MWVFGQWLVTNQVDDQWSVIKGIYQNKDYCKRVSPPPGFIKKNQEKLKWSETEMAIDKKLRSTLQLQIFRQTRLSLWKATESVSIWGSWTLWILIHPVWCGVIIMIHCELEERHNTQSLIYKLNIYFQYLQQSSFPTLENQKYPDPKYHKSYDDQMPL